MRNLEFSLPEMILRFLFLIILIFPGLDCTGQVTQQPPTQPSISKDTAAARPSPTQQQPELPKSGVRMLSDPTRGDGFAFFDSTGQETGFLSELEIAGKNPYKQIELEPRERNRDTGNFDLYEVGSRSVLEIKAGLPKKLKSMPPDSVLRNAGEIAAFISGWDYDRQNPNFLVVTYALVIYDREYLSENWAEVTLHVYDNKGNLVATIVDNHNIDGVFISPDGQYILANQILGWRGDGVSDLNIGMILYSVKQSKYIGAIDKHVSLHYNRFKYENHKFLTYATVYKDLYGSIDEIIFTKLIIDPVNKIYYRKICGKNPCDTTDFTEGPVFSLKSHSYVDGEDISTYEAIHF